ncbi:Oxysterol-binding protein-domain-containing protein [Pisolithus albus]|nr:Oxysterol-binding protein-domain-containing protein [Pisolithus albus]
MANYSCSPRLAVSSDQAVVCQGWLLKKRRKKLQGFARRYFVLRESGILSYSISPKHPVRDQIAIPHAALSTCTGAQRYPQDFNTWMAAFRSVKFCQEAPPVVIAELEAAITLLQLDDPHKKNSSLKSKSDKEKSNHKDNNFGNTLYVLHVMTLHCEAGGHHEDGTLPKSMTESNLHAHYQRINAAVETLKAQHTALLRSLNGMQGDATQPVARASPLPPTAEDKSEELLSPSRFSTAFTRRSKRASSLSSLSDGGPVEWFDAQDNVGEEFVLEEPTPDEERGPIILQTSFSNYKEYESSSSDEEEREQHLSKPEPDLTLQARQVTRRTCLPCGPVGDEGSLFAILKKNVGKDLSTITFPVSFNEPLTMLQQAAEGMEYHELLQQAVDSKDPVERICFIAAFAVSGYAHTRHRSGRKGFNPMLAETFEDSRMRFIAEKVSHNPVVIAYHAEGNGWQLDGKSAGRTKFWGKSLEVIPLGATRLKIDGDVYEWNKPSSFIRNLMMGTKYLEHCGKMTINNLMSGLSCAIEFKPAGYWGVSNEVAGAVMSPSGEVHARIEGKWDEQLALALDPLHLRVLWRISPFPKQALDYYGFTAYAITLNEITNDLEGKLPPTDSRLRPDVRALEEGNIELAEEEKTRLEELQRERRRRGVDREPRWFKQVGEDWLYVGGYWEARAKGWRDSLVDPLW